MRKLLTGQHSHHSAMLQGSLRWSRSLRYRDMGMCFIYGFNYLIIPLENAEGWA